MSTPAGESTIDAHERAVSIDQAAHMLNLSVRTIYNRIKEGRLQTVRGINGRQRVLMESLYAEGFREQSNPTSRAAGSHDMYGFSRYWSVRHS